VAEGVRGDDEFVAVAGDFTGLRRVHDPGVEQHAVQSHAAADGRRGGAHRAEVAGVERERLEVGIRHLRQDRGART